MNSARRGRRSIRGTDGVPPDRAAEHVVRDLKVGIVGLGWVSGAPIETLKRVPGVRVAHSSKLKTMDKTQWGTIPTPRDDSDDIREHPYLPQFRAFAEAVRGNRTMPLTDFETAFETHRVRFAADLSAAEGRPVRLSEFA